MTQTDPNSTSSDVHDLIEELQVAGEQLLGKIKSLLSESAVRRIRIKQDDRVILEIPLALGVAGAVLAPTLAAIGAVGALLAQCTIEVVRSERPTASSPSPEAPSATSVSEEETPEEL